MNTNSTSEDDCKVCPGDAPYSNPGSNECQTCSSCENEECEEWLDGGGGLLPRLRPRAPFVAAALVM